ARLQGGHRSGQAIGEDIGEDKAGALLGETLGRAPPEAARRAAHQHDLVRERTGHRAFPPISSIAMPASTGTASPIFRPRSGLEALPSSTRFLTPCRMAARRKKLKARQKVQSGMPASPMRRQ